MVLSLRENTRCTRAVSRIENEMKKRIIKNIENEQIPQAIYTYRVSSYILIVFWCAHSGKKGNKTLKIISKEGNTREEKNTRKDKIYVTF